MRKHWIVAVAAIVVAVGVGVGVAYAVIPDSSRALGLGAPIGTGFRTEGALIEVTAVGPNPSQQILSLTLPRGSYAISAELNVEKPIGHGVFACAVPTGGLFSAPVGGWTALGEGAGESHADTFSGTGLDVLPNGGTARLVCRQFAGATGANPVIQQVALSAVRIGAVNTQ